MRGRNSFPAVARAIVFFVIYLAGTMNPYRTGAQSYDAPFLMNERIVERFFERIGDPEHSGTELSDYLEYLLGHPIRINRIGTEDRDRLLLLSDFQIFAITNYLQDRGPILSASELALVNGFDAAFAKGIAPFIDFSIDLTYSGFREAFSDRNFSHVIQVRSSAAMEIRDFRIDRPENLSRDRISLQSRYDFEWGNHFSAAMTYEKDRGERLLSRRGRIVEPEMLAYTLSAHRIRIGSRVLIQRILFGDFSVSFGQGLCISGASTLFSSSDPTAAGRKSEVLRPFRSENGKLFGGAADLIIKGNGHEFEICTFFSDKLMDAVIESGKYTSLPATGLHDTPSSLKARRAISLISTGNSLVFRRRDLEVGIHQIIYRYSRKNGMQPKYWNRYRIFDGWWGNIGIEASYRRRSLRLFGELSTDFTPAAAGIAGCTFYPSAKIVVSGIYRGYGVRYKSPFAVNSGFNTSPDNEHSLEILTDINLDYVWRFQISGGTAYHPYFRYGIRRPSLQGRFFFRSIRTSGNWEFNLSAGVRLHSYGHPVQFKGSISLKGRIGDFDLRLKGGTNLTALNKKGTGYYLSTEGSWNHESSVSRFCMAVTAGATFFDCREWENRNYIHERDLLHAYSSVLLYGTGIRGFLLLKIKTRHTETRIKAGCEVKDRLRDIRPVIKIQTVLKL